MASAKQAAPKRVAVITGDGKFGTVEEHEVGLIAEGGGRVLSKQEAAEREVQARYDAKSTAEKAIGYAETAALATPFAPVVAAGIGDEAAPEVAAFGAGTRHGLTAGLSEGITRQAIEKFGTHAQGEAYAERVQQTRDASPIAHGAGALFGMGLGTAAGAAAPAGAISAVGNVAEQAAARGLAGLASRGAIGRALATGGELAVRGAVEGALFGGVERVTEDMLGDRELVADKLFAATGMGALGGAAFGGALGFSGSLLKSGAQAGATAASSGLARVLGKSESAIAQGRASVDTAAMRAQAAVAEAKALGREVADDAVAAAKRTADEAVDGAKRLADDAVTTAKQKAEDAADAARRMGADTADELARSGRTLAEVTGTKLDQEQAVIRVAIDRSKQVGTQKEWAYEQAWKAAGGGQGLQTTRFAKQAEKYLPNGTKDVGEVMMRKGIINASDGIVSAVRGGTPADMLPKVLSAVEENGQKLGKLTETSGARVMARDVDDVFSSVIKKYDDVAGREGEVAAIKQYRQSLLEKLNLPDMELAKAGNLDALTERSTEASIQALLKQRKGLDEIIYAEQKTLDPKGRLAALRDVRTELERLVMDKLDEVSGKLPGELRAEYQALKRDHVALSIAKDAIEDSAARMAKARSVSLTDYLAGGGSIPVTVAHKIVRERGNAAAAVALYRMAEMGTLTKAIQSIDDAVSKAARGALVGPRPASKAAGRAVDAAAKETAKVSGGPYRGEEKPPVRERAKAAMERVMAIQANPEAYIERVAKATEPMMQTAPGVSGAYMQRATSAAAFLASKLPVQPEADPFDPRPMARLSQAQAMQFMRYVDYVDKPARFFDEAARGQITFEGVEVAKALMPKAFAEMQVRVAEGLAEMLAKGQHVPLRQRERLGLLMDAPLVPSQRPEQVAFLQGNVVGSDKANQPPPPSGAGKPTAIKSSSSALDKLEERGAGRR